MGVGWGRVGAVALTRYDWGGGGGWERQRKCWVTHSILLRSSCYWGTFEKFTLVGVYDVKMSLLSSGVNGSGRGFSRLPFGDLPHPSRKIESREA